MDNTNPVSYTHLDVYKRQPVYSEILNQMKKDTEETVVSTFGILTGREIYRWGIDGIHGVRLHTVHIDQERMCLTFGDTAQTMRIELLHGLTQKQEVMDTAQKLLHETGVQPDIIGWK